MQREELERWVRRSKTAQALTLRARIVLASATGKTDLAVATDLGTTRVTVGKWRRWFLQSGCDGLLDEARPGAPRTDSDVERVVSTTLESLPRDATHWSTRSMASVCGLRAATVGRVRPATPPLRDLQVVEGPAVHRERARYRRPVPASAREGGGLVRPREVADAGPGPYLTGAADAPAPAGTAHARLPAARNHVAVRRPERGDRQSAHAMPPAVSRGRVRQVSACHRQGGARRRGHPCCSGQLWDPQVSDDPRVARASSLLSPALHPHECVVAQPWSSAGSRCPPRSRSAGAQTEARRSWSRQPSSTSRSTMRIRSRSCGPRPRSTVQRWSDSAGATRPDRALPVSQSLERPVSLLTSFQAT